MRHPLSPAEPSIVARVGIERALGTIDHIATVLPRPQTGKALCGKGDIGVGEQQPFRPRCHCPDLPRLGDLGRTPDDLRMLRTVLWFSNPNSDKSSTQNEMMHATPNIPACAVDVADKSVSLVLAQPGLHRKIR